MSSRLTLRGPGRTRELGPGRAAIPRRCAASVQPASGSRPRRAYDRGHPTISASTCGIGPIGKAAGCWQHAPRSRNADRAASSRYRPDAVYDLFQRRGQNHAAFTPTRTPQAGSARAGRRHIKRPRQGLCADASPRSANALTRSLVNFNRYFIRSLPRKHCCDQEFLVAFRPR